MNTLTNEIPNTYLHLNCKWYSLDEGADQANSIPSVSVIVTEGEVAWGATSERAAWEAEQVRLDREWYALDEGADQANNPFSNVSEEYARKKEQQLEQRKKKRMSAQQRQINKVNQICLIIAL